MKILAKFFLILIVVLSTRFAFAEQATDKVIRYSEYGAKGDGLTDDFEAIIKAHAAANETGAKVCADPGASYYIGGTAKTAQIQTDTDWGDAKFVIDDTKTEHKNRNFQIFNVSSKLPSARLNSVKTLKKGQEKLDLSLPHDSVIILSDRTSKRYIRLGLNQNNGADQTDVFILGKDGKVDMKAPIIWDFDNITSMTAYPIDEETLHIRGGHFTTVANQAESKYDYYGRGINITRSNTVIEGLRHEITGEIDHGAPYSGFILVSSCANITIRNCKLSGHKTYSTVGSAGKPVSMGSYDISVNRAVNVTFKDCEQVNDIQDTKLWGIFGSNFSKNITFDTVKFSRFDAHMGVHNATIRNSVLGQQGINLIGSGVFLLENTKVCGSNMINLRGDYGSTFEGEIVIRNCEYVPRNGAQSDAVIISGSNSGQHDFGYTCYMPEKITIYGLIIDDANPVRNYQGPKIFGVFNSAYKDETYVEKYPYVVTKELEIEELTIKSGKPYVISNNPFPFRNLKVTEK